MQITVKELYIQTQSNGFSIFDFEYQIGQFST